MSRTEDLRRALLQPLRGTSFSGLGEYYEGKVRDNYTKGDERLIVVTDRISAFDRVLGTVPLKGQILNGMAAFWFDKTKNLVANHMVDSPDPNVMRVRQCTPLSVEIIVRAYITGVTSTSIWTHYAQGKREFCGHRLPDGLRKNQKLPQAIVTPSTKAAHGDHDVSVSRAELLEMGHVSAADFDAASAMAMKLFGFGQQWASDRGLILVDTKYEFGRSADGQLMVIDEIHTPDSSRYWFSNTYEEKFSKGLDPESFDKEYVRRYLAEQGFKGDGPIPSVPDDVWITAAERYIEAFERITGAPFVPNLEDPLPRIRRNLGLTPEAS